MLHDKGQNPQQPAVNDSDYRPAPIMRAVVDWELVYRVFICLIAALSVLWCLVSPLRFIESSYDTFVFITMQDAPLMGMSVALGNTTLLFNQSHTKFATVAAIATLVCALVI